MNIIPEKVELTGEVEKIHISSYLKMILAT